MGAATVHLDTVNGRARYTLAEPRELDFPLMQRAVWGAGYTARRIRIELEGSTGPARCATCGEQGPMLRAEATGQLLHLRGEAPHGPGPWGFEVEGWTDGHPTLRVAAPWERASASPPDSEP